MFSPCFRNLGFNHEFFKGSRGYSGGALVCFFYADYLILDKLFELCPFMLTVKPHENHVDDFFQAQLQEIIKDMSR